MVGPTPPRSSAFISLYSCVNSASLTSLLWLLYAARPLAASPGTLIIGSIKSPVFLKAHPQGSTLLNRAAATARPFPPTLAGSYRLNSSPCRSVLVSVNNCHGDTKLSCPSRVSVLPFSPLKTRLLRRRHANQPEAGLKY